MSTALEVERRIGTVLTLAAGKSRAHNPRLEALELGVRCTKG
jgi:hypothetical protein